MAVNMLSTERKIGPLGLKLVGGLTMMSSSIPYSVQSDLESSRRTKSSVCLGVRRPEYTSESRSSGSDVHLIMLVSSPVYQLRN